MEICINTQSGSNMIQYHTSHSTAVTQAERTESEFELWDKIDHVIKALNWKYIYIYTFFFIYLFIYLFYFYFYFYFFFFWGGGGGGGYAFENVQH